MADDNNFDQLNGKAAGLNGTLAQTSVLVSGFDSELRRMRVSLAAAGKDMATMERGLSRGLRRAFDGVVLDGMKLTDALRSVAQTMAHTAYNAAIKPVTQHIGGLISQGVGTLVQNVLPFEQGAPFSQGRVIPFARGGVVSAGRVQSGGGSGIVAGPTHFPMRGSYGLMGEAGPEAIMPLARGADGKLGVRGGGGRGDVHVVMNITTPDVQGFQRSQSQIAAQLSRALNTGNRNR
ncbi:phage tail tape measure protein [Sulfitobacter mediterraneus]|uniref:phage tail tape measure protein n=1 Tax=Sulfitobacter mediterraneus TaxID=83219 RepID=UPI00193AA406|nr:phage tail tape measure protein [Sulfitobacter mediterraneus]MBM1556897.1 phage tail tape measure protein [Sulfitobacter mediterraneus]MBM1569082.1 phage tail tape measure protein [Sulfitobacter mediterraneus]MBM1572509.1 phage tail tape measure protein [Sulfitobacter mediterraneus]MBM1576672.1 phage tail tape measure protein [Sulfitobacter mediterraneus]MBM1579855.1 phage tail tape measure protein [Sulfitobacter mediterraneus]